jgi:hypothetical protein
MSSEGTPAAVDSTDPAPLSGMISGLSFFPERPDWEIQTLRLIAESEYGGADIFECLRLAVRIRARGLTEDVWREEWMALGRSLATEGIDFSSETGALPTEVTRASASLRAMNYLRTAEFFMPYDDPGRLELFMESRAAFRKALPHLPVDIEPVVVPAAAESYEGYIYKGACHPRGRVRPSRSSAAQIHMRRSCTSLARVRSLTAASVSSLPTHRDAVLLSGVTA